MRNSHRWPLWLSALAYLPRNALSRAAGRLVSLRLPGPLQRAEIRCFARAVGVDLAEVRDPIESFESLQAFFTRALEKGARRIDPEPAAFVAPCDGLWGASGRVEAGVLLQVKGRRYTLAGLLDDPEAAQRFEGGAYATLYLSPRDYHRFHAPCDAEVERLVHVPGTLWPVNRAGLAHIDGLFCANERLIAHLRLPAGGALCIAAVGATNVGRIRVTFDGLVTNRSGAQRSERCYERPIPLGKGEEWGRFEFGSTLVVVGSADAFELDAAPPGSPLRLGTRIGRLIGRCT